MRAYSDEEILNRVANLPSFKGFPNGVFDVWIREKKQQFNLFTDKVFTYTGYGSKQIPHFELAASGTSRAGRSGLKLFHTYNQKGCAVLKSDIIVYDSHIYGLHKGKPAYIQSYNTPFPYFRDGDKDDQAEEIGKEYYDRIGANCHRAGAFSQFIENWSVACLVRNQGKQFDTWLNFLISRGKKPLSVAILKEF